MYQQNKPNKSSLKRNTSIEGETIEHKINRIVNNNEPISDGAPIIFTERKDGVLPEYDIRTDRFEVATEAMDKVTKDKLAKRDQRFQERTDKILELDGGDKEKKGKETPLEKGTESKEGGTPKE